MIKKGILIACATLLACATTPAAERDVPISQFGSLDHVFLILMENETDTDILGNPNAPFINAYAKVANQAINYFAVGHPSAPNYLEIVGGSNFGLKNDFWPNWAGMGCIDHAPNSTGCNNAFTPVSEAGLDNEVVATATEPGQCNGEVEAKGAAAANNCALRDYPATSFTPKSIANQLVTKNKSWKTYQQSLPSLTSGVFGVNYADGTWSNLSPTGVFVSGPIQKLYAVKHNPFAYFRDIEVGTNPALSLSRVADFSGDDGLWAELHTHVASLSLIVPDQCHDMHGYVNGGPPICLSRTDAEKGLLMEEGDAALAQLVKGIKNAPVWKHGRNVIVIVWDENDYSNAANRVVMLVETNYANNHRVSTKFYDHYSLLRTLEAGFGLPCLNHACDATSEVMNDLFGASEK